MPKQNKSFISKKLEEVGRYLIKDLLARAREGNFRDDWFVKDYIRSKDIKDFLISTLTEFADKIRLEKKEFKNEDYSNFIDPKLIMQQDMGRTMGYNTAKADLDKRISEVVDSK